MSRLMPTVRTIKALFGKSGNQCAFPGCTHPVTNDKNTIIAQICHIEAAQSGSPRYNPGSTDEYRRSYENLLILCYRHHKETDDVEEYSVDDLVKMKHKHENQFQESILSVDESELINLAHEMEKYWNEVEKLNKVEHIIRDFAVEVKTNNDFSAIITDIYHSVDGIQTMLDCFHASDKDLYNDFELLLSKKGINKELFDDISYYENPFINRNWEMHNLGARNWLLSLRVALSHAEIKYWEEYLKTNSNDLEAKARFEKVKNILKEYAKSAALAD